MENFENPKAPGPDSRPADLEKRNGLIRKAETALERTRLKMPARSLILVGLSGSGTTALLDHIREIAEAKGILTIRIQALKCRSLPGLLAPQLHQTLTKLSNNEKSKPFADRALRALVGFVATLRVTYRDIDMDIDGDSEKGLADNGNLEHDLQDLFEAAGDAVAAAESAVAIFIDELQCIERTQLAALITALHRTSQRRLPVMLVGAGLPELRARIGIARSYAERLLEFTEIALHARKSGGPVS